jgi:hypothetical protein
VRALRALAGFRGRPPADRRALVEAVAAIGRLGLVLGDRPVSLDVNPLIVGPRGRGAVAIDLLAVVKTGSARRKGLLPRARVAAGLL